MSDFAKNIPQQVRLSIAEVQEKWDDPDYTEDITSDYDWKSKVKRQLRNGDIDAMRKAAMPSIQYEVIKLAHNAKSQQTQLSAAQFLLAQEGQGAVQKVDHLVQYDKLPPDQLKAIILSKVQSLQDKIPGFSLEDALSQMRSSSDPILIEASPTSTDQTQPESSADES